MSKHTGFKMKLTGVLLVSFLAAHVLLADETNNVMLTVDGIIYSNVTWGTVTPSTVSIFHQTGVARIRLETLPRDLQERFGYEPEKARDYDEAVRAAEAARQEALNKQQAGLEVQRAKEEAERQQEARRVAELKEAASAIKPINFVTVTNIVTLTPGMHQAVLIDAAGNGVSVRFDDDGKRFLEVAAAEQQRITSVNEQRHKQAEIARGDSYSGAIMVTPYSVEAVQSPPLRYKKLDTKVFTVYAVPVDGSAFQLVGSRMTEQQDGVPAVSW
jgi:hypothetical protein